MRLLSVIGFLARKLSTRSTLRRLATCLMVPLIGQTALFTLAYQAAAEHLRRNDPRRLQNRSEVSFFFAPLKVHVGMRMSSEDIVAYLRELGYEQRAGDARGAFNIVHHTINLTPRSPAFQPIAITIERNRITDLVAGEKTVAEAELEPLPMQEFVRYLNDDSLKEQRLRRTMITPGSVPEVVADAVTSAEDCRFFEHYGIDVYGIAHRVFSGQGGGSSITQQLLKNTIFKGAKEEFWQNYLGFLPESLQRKATDLFLALAAEKLMTKDEILAAYLSVVPLGAVAGVELHGVAVAAQEYFGQPVLDLNLAEAATLAAMFNRPSDYVSKARQGDYRDLIDRRNSVLDLMRRNNPQKYSEEVIERAQAEPLQFVFASTRLSERPVQAYSRQFAELAALNLPEEVSQLQIREGPLEVFTTLDFSLQRDAARIAETAARELQAKIIRVCRTHPATGELDCSKLEPQIALIAMEAQTGRILAMVGGVNSEFNHATASRSPGSAIKPFVYLNAIERANYRGQPFTAATLIDPQTDSLRGYRPTRNVGRASSVRAALARSFNFHAVAAAEAAGLDETVEFLRQVTGSHPEVNGMAALGGTAGSETSLLKLVQAYGVFPNNGLLRPATFQQSFAQDGVRKELPETQPMRVADKGAAFVVTQMLSSVVGPQGTAPAFLGLAGFQADSAVAAKSGTGMIADVSFIASTPRLVVGVWAGLPQNEVLLRLEDGFSGTSIAAPITAKFMRVVREVRPELLAGHFHEPPNVTRLRIDSKANCMSTGGDLEEYFIIGREPWPCAKR